MEVHAMVAYVTVLALLLYDLVSEIFIYLYSRGFATCASIISNMFASQGSCSHILGFLSLEAVTYFDPGWT